VTKVQDIMPFVAAVLRRAHERGEDAMTAKSIWVQLALANKKASVSSVRRACDELCAGPEPEAEYKYSARSCKRYAKRYAWMGPERAAEVREQGRRLALAVLLETRLNDAGYSSAHNRGTIVCLEADEAARLMHRAGVPFEQDKWRRG
jgi:hypothetical protein